MGNLFYKPQDVNWSRLTSDQERRFKNQWEGVTKWLRAMAIYNIIVMAIGMLILFLIAAINSFSAWAVEFHIVLTLPFFGIFIMWANFEVAPNKWML